MEWKRERRDGEGDGNFGWRPAPVHGGGGEVGATVTRAGTRRGPAGWGSGSGSQSVPVSQTATLEPGPDGARSGWGKRRRPGGLRVLAASACARACRRGAGSAEWVAVSDPRAAVSRRVLGKRGEASSFCGGGRWRWGR